MKRILLLMIRYWDLHSAKLLRSAAQTNLVSYSRPEMMKAVTVQVMPCRIFIAREDSGCSGDGQESKSSASSWCFFLVFLSAMVLRGGRSGRGPHFQPLKYDKSCIELTDAAAAALC